MAGSALALTAAVGLAACQHTPLKPALPAPTAAAAWREGAADNVWPAKDWWRAFGSPELDDLIAKAEQNNDDLAAAVARVRQADAQARIAGAPLLPSIEVSPEAAAIRKNSPLFKERHYGDFTGVFTASYQLDVWGKNHAALDAAKSSATAARYARQVVELTTVAGVASTYIQILALQDLLATTQAELAAAQTLLDDLQAKQSAGLATELEVANQQVVVQNLQEAVAPLQAQRAHALDALAILTGQSPETLQVEGKSLSELKVPALAGGLPSQLLSHRPDVQQAERQLEAANADIAVARAQFLPSFDLGVSGGVEAMGLASGLMGPSLIYNLAFGAVQPVFEGGRLKGQLERAKGREAELLANYIQATRQAYSDVEDALASVRSAQAQQAAAEGALDKAETALQLTRSGYQAGIADALSVTAAQSAMLPNREAVAQAQTTRLQSLVALYTALGGGWSAPS